MVSSDDRRAPATLAVPATGHPVSADALLEVRNLRAQFQLADRVAHAVEGVSFSIGRGEIVGLVGESGCGKSVTTQCILRTLPAPGRIVAGEILFKGQDLLKQNREEMRAI